MTDLELALLHLQEDIEIPEIVLTIHPTVRQVISQVRPISGLSVLTVDRPTNRTVKPQFKTLATSKIYSTLRVISLFLTRELLDSPLLYSCFAHHHGRVDDAQFLNALQRCVSKWIREMQKVTKLDRDPSSGTTMQEVSFWLNLEQV